MLKTTIIQSAAEFEGIRELWEELSARGTIFQSFRWNRLAAECFSARERPYVVCCESDSGAAILPVAIRRDGSLSLLGEELFDYRDVLYQGEPAVLSRAFKEITGSRRPFKLVALRGEECARRWTEANPKLYTYAPCITGQDLSGFSIQRPNAGSGAVATERFLRLHSRLGRHSRRTRKHGITLRRYSGAESAVVRFIYESKGVQSADSANLFRERARREFMIRIAAEEKSCCEMFAYEHGSALVAAIVTFRRETTRHFYTIYYDPRWSDLSPGQILLFEATAESLREGLECDYMTGEYAYKTRLATSRVPLFSVELPADQLPTVFQPRETESKIA